MVYILNKTTQAMFREWNSSVANYYSTEDADSLRTIIQKGISAGYLSNDDVYDLLEVLPRIIPQISTNRIHEDDTDSERIDPWEENQNEQLNKLRKEVTHFHHVLSNWIFLQGAVYQKQLRYRRDAELNRIGRARRVAKMKEEIRHGR